MKPNRWLHLRHPSGFNDNDFARFAAHCRVFETYVKVLFAEWRALGAGNYEPPAYEFGEPELAADRLVATLPLGGTSTLGSRAIIENMSSQFLWRFFSPQFRQQLEEGITEDTGNGLHTNWRKVPALTVPFLAAPELPVV